MPDVGEPIAVPAHPCFRNRAATTLFSERLFLTAAQPTIGREERSFMPDAWNAAIYRERAAAWRDKATTLPEDSRERDLCRHIAQGYDDLADLIEQHTNRPD
jgi:hypothetical protein